MPDKKDLPEGTDEALKSKLEILSSDQLDQYNLIVDLLGQGQAHLFEECEDDESLRKFADHLQEVDKACPEGIIGYIKQAKKLLQDAKEGANPLDGWKPTIPSGESFQLGTENYRKVEKKGLRVLGNVGFVLVAGGLGERLGYSHAKIGLPTETTTGTSYIQYYCEYIKAVEKKMGRRSTRLPLCIMVSEDTKRDTFKLLKDNKCYGLRRRQVYIVEQGMGVPALGDSDAKLVLKDGKLVMKPHGHGDIHALLHKDGITRKWERKGIKYMVLFQDTNGLAFHSLPLMLGVSEGNGFIMNSLAIPRKAKQAIGGIAKLINEKTGAQKTINIEYNQLDPLLRTTEEFKDGDVNDEKTGYSPFPGNINQLVFQLKGYNKVLERTHGRMPDFVNPKYTDDSKTTFKKPTRLECMMQDFPNVLENSETKKVGYTQLAAELCFSPVKNSVSDGVALQEKDIAPATAATGEADQYNAARIMMKSIGCKIEEAEPVEYNGIKITPGPSIVLKPDFACCPAEYGIKFPSPEKVKISARSTLVCRGPGVTIESLDLDGALIIDVERGEEAIVRDLRISNEGWVKVPVGLDDEDEKLAMRGFRIERKDAKYIDVRCEKKENDDEDDDDISYAGSEYTIVEQFGCALYPIMSEDEMAEEKSDGCSIM